MGDAGGTQPWTDSSVPIVFQGPWQCWFLPHPHPWPWWIWEWPKASGWVTGRSCQGSCVSESTGVPKSCGGVWTLTRAWNWSTGKWGSLADSSQGSLAMYLPLQGMEGHVRPHETGNWLIIMWPLFITIKNVLKFIFQILILFSFLNCLDF